MNKISKGLINHKDIVIRKKAVPSQENLKIWTKNKRIEPNIGKLAKRTHDLNCEINSITPTRPQ